MKLTKEQIDEVIKWMNTWEQLKGTAIPMRFKEDFTEHEQKLNIHGVGGPASASVSEGEQLGNEGWGKAVCRDCGCKLTLVRPGKYQCDNIVCISNQ